MNDDSLATIELELAFLVRLITSRTSNKGVGNLDRSAYLLLHEISVEGSAGVKALGDALLLDISTASRQAAALEQKGYAVKVPDEQDGRAYFYQITELGAQAISEYKQSRQASIARLLDEWPEEERQLLGEMLHKFNHVLRTKK
ncbi:MarR family winged helix-turn-helix transcriptional regulator [Paenibacillus sp. 2TAB19]|uniref:MarR family winged helix-turn-helix transcriptional regulator n=1 Tax=Paenibacillus sp. 2TAB19 TaxID=3233003 RepID=UPI003F9A5EC0